MVWIDIVSSEVGEQESSTNRSIIVHIFLPVPMVGRSITRVLRELFCYWSDPNGSKSHSLNVIQLGVQSVYRFGVKELIYTWLIIPCQLPPQ